MKLGWKLSLAAAAVLLATSSASAQPRQGPGGPGHRPPKEALDACASLKVGDACSFTLESRTLKGTCRGPADKPAACAPDDMLPPGEHRGPPQAALDACQSLRAGDTCSFSMDGRDVTGSCQACPKDGRIACAPADMRRGPPQESLDACAKLEVGDACSFTHDGRSLTGTCRGPADKPAACAPNDLPPPGEHRGPPPAALDACKSLRDGDSCSFSIDGRDVKGSCRSGPEGQPAACMPSDMPHPQQRR
ncbi:MAG TPA: hypothetical protein VGK67_25355 [Myxococcales bacterium]|jgi:hypothetical protein